MALRQIFEQPSNAYFLLPQVTFFEFLRSMAALGVHDSGAHVAGFAPSKTQLSGGASSSIPLSARSGSSRRRGYYDDYGDGGVGGARRGRGSGSRRRKRRPRISGEGTAYDYYDDHSYDDDDDEEEEEEEEEDSTSVDDAYGEGYRRKSPPGRGLSPRRGGGGERRRRGSTSPVRRSAGSRGSGLSPRRSPARGGGSRRGRVAGSGDSSSDLAEEVDVSSTKRRRRSRSGDPKNRGSSR